MSHSGGLIYHWRALRFKDSFWDRHRVDTEKFLNDWNPKSNTLVIVGPSGGYSLPPEFLKRFAKIIAVEPDALARIIFERRFHLKPSWIKKSLNFSSPVDPHLFPPKCAFLFSNVLGQLRIRKLVQFQEHLRALVQGHEWASYHDAMSGEGFEFDTEDAGNQKASLADMKSWIYLKNKNVSQLEVTAHDAPELFSGKDQLQYRYWQWRLTSKKSHLIEGVFQRQTLRLVDSPEGSEL